MPGRNLDDVSLLISPRLSGAPMSKRCQELRLVTMEITMHCIVACIPSVLNVRVIGGLVETAVRVMPHSTALAQAVSGITIDSATTYQVIDGLGCSEAFQRSNELYGSLSAKHQQALDLLFGPHIGIGFTFLRNIIGSSPDNAANHVTTIEPHSPGASWATPTSTWDSSDQSQIWLSHQAPTYGATQIIAGAWSAPGYMKTNGSDGTRCGVPGATCVGEDRRSLG